MRKIAAFEGMDVTEKVEGPTLWVSPLMVVHKKGGDIRICADMRLFCVSSTTFPITDEILEDMMGAKHTTAKECH